MKRKICTKCKKAKFIIYFYKHKGQPDGYARQCKNCMSAYFNKHKVRKQKYDKEYQYKNKENLKILSKKYYENNKEAILEKNKKYRKFHKVEDNIRKKLYRKNNQNLYRKKRRNIERNARKNINYKILGNLRSRLYKAVKGISHSKRTQELLGCSVSEFKLHLISSFKPGMNWDNYGKWHIDHIKPCAKFDLTKQEELEKCFHYTNLQPLWASENLSKHTK